jgi:hypothetical protein
MVIYLSGLITAQEAYPSGDEVFGEEPLDDGGADYPVVDSYPVVDAYPSNEGDEIIGEDEAIKQNPTKKAKVDQEVVSLLPSHLRKRRKG